MNSKNRFQNIIWTAFFSVILSGAFTNISSAETGLIQPENLLYKGAFRLPDVSMGSDWTYSGYGMTFYPDGDPAGPADGYPGSLYAVGHDQDQMLSEINIPTPVISALKDPEDLNTATTLQPFTDIRSSIFGYMDIPSPGLAYLPAQGSQSTDKLHFCWSQWIQTGEPSHGWLELDLSTPNIAGPWRFGNFSNYLTNDFLFEIPKEWSDTYTPGLRLVSGRFREGPWSGYGPSLFAYGPWNDGNPPVAGSTLTNITLLLSYGSDLESSEVTVNPSRAMNEYQLSDTFAGGAWLTSGNNSAIILCGTKATGRSWYGYGNGVEYPYLDVDENTVYPEVPDWPFDNRGFWSEGIEAQFIFYNPNDLAKVATKNMAAYEPQPYAVMTLDSYLFDGSSIDFERGKKHLLGAMAFDRANGLIYVMERRADEEKSLVHVFKINPGQNLYFRDNDQDGYGDPGCPLEASSQPSGFVSDNTDCNDLDDDIHPGSTEIFNSMDDNCDGIIDNIVPDKVTLISASGTSDDIAQTFTWNEDPYSTWYKLFIWDSSEKTVHTHWYGAAKVCSEGICSVSLESALLVGEYEWFVKSWNDYGSIWTDGMAVTIQSNDTPPSKVIHTSPSYQTQNPTPSFTWQADPNSTWYRLWVGYPGDQKIFAQWYAAKDICSGDNCSVITGTELMDGEYEWYIKSWNEFGRVWSDGMSFTVFLSFLF